MTGTIGFVGLGRMGGGMAARLAGRVDLLVFDQHPEAVERAVAAGARAAPDVADLARSVSVVFVSLPGPAQVEEVVLGAGGIAESMAAGLLVVDLSTNSLETVRRVAAEMDRRGGGFLDAPISGGPAGAASGDLALWVGGKEKVFEDNLALLRTVGDKAVRVGDVGSGTVTKLVHNLMGYTLMQAMGECFSLGTKAGLDPLDLWQALRLGAVGRSSPLDMLTRQFLPGSYDTPAFLLELAHKDVRLATELARQMRVPMRIADQTMAEMTEALNRGMGREDSRAFLKLQLERAGVRIAVDPGRIARALDAMK